jgi:hypothetical protein
MTYYMTLFSRFESLFLGIFPGCNLVVAIAYLTVYISLCKRVYTTILQTVTSVAAMIETSGIGGDMRRVLSWLMIAASIAFLITGESIYTDISLTPNTMLDNHVYSSKIARSILDSVVICSQESRCMSFNSNNYSGLCELNNVSKRKAMLTDAPGYIYGEEISATHERQVIIITTPGPSTPHGRQVGC